MASPVIIPKSVYYDGPVTETDRAQNRAGTPDFTVGAPGYQLTVSAHPTIPFALVVRKGTASAYGVTAHVATDPGGADMVIQCDTNAAGTRWDLISIRYDWRQENGGPSELCATNAGGKQLPGNLENSPGVVVDQPLWLVRWTGNASAPAEYVDLRCFAANGGVMANDVLALGYLAKPGAAIRIGTNLWRYEQVGNGQWGWRDYPLEKPMQHAEWTYEFTARSGVNHGPDGGREFQATRSVGASFVSLPGGFLEVNAPGIYLISFHNDWGGAANDSCFLSLIRPTDLVTVASVNASTGAGSTTLPATAHYLRPGTEDPGNRLALRIRHNMGSDRVMRGRIRITKIG